MISYSLDLAEKLEPSGRSGGRSPYFHESRLPRKPTPPTTVPDEVVSIVLNISFNIQPENLERIKEEHRFSMAAENIVGDLLER